MLAEWSNAGPNTEEHHLVAYNAVLNPTFDHDAAESRNQAHDDVGSPHKIESLKNGAAGTKGTDNNVYTEKVREGDIVVDMGDDQGENDDEEDESDDDDEEDEEDESDDEFGEFLWLEPIDVSITSMANLDERGVPKQVAYCQAKLIRRSQIPDDFYEEMEQPTSETSMLAFDLFDRYGRLRSEFTTHPVIKGSGVWGRELDRGDMLLIEEVFVTQDHRRQQLGRRMIESLLTLVRQKTWSFFAFVWPTLLKRRDIKLEWDSLQDDAARNRMEDREQNRAVMFYRSLGFRRVGSTVWFALASDIDHPSHQLTSTDDFNPLEATLSALDPLLSPFEQIGNPPPSAWEQMLNHEPRETPVFLDVLHSCMQQTGSADACWMSKDKDGNTVLHLAASIFDVKCVEWILNQDFGPELLQLRNNRGATPLESLQFKLEKLRTKRVIGGLTLSVSDKFKGHDESAVRCLILLKGLGPLESLMGSHREDALLQTVRGCTCGQCLQGFLSPRMAYTLIFQAEIGYDMMKDDLGSGSCWDLLDENYLGYLPSRVRNNLRTNKSMRQGVLNLWLHVATCLQSGKVPNEPNVLEVLRNGREWPPATKNFLQRGGTVESVFLAICRRAMTLGEFMEDAEEIAKLSECRNDLEFGYVSGMCGYRRITHAGNVDMMGRRLDEDGNRIDSLL